MRTIETEAELLQIIAAGSKLTRTYRVSAAVAESNRRKLLGRNSLRRMTEAETREMASYLNLEFDEIRAADPKIDDIHCPACGRNMTFLDLIHNSVSSGIHSREFAADVISGKLGHFITVDGADDDSHRYKCLNCGDTSFADRDHSHDGYTTCKGSGSYAHCAW